MVALLPSMLDVLKELIYWLLELPEVFYQTEKQILGPLLPTIEQALPEEFWSGFGYADYFAPVHEFLGLLGVYWGVLGIVFGYRLLKSWIPTMSGSG